MRELFVPVQQPYQHTAQNSCNYLIMKAPYEHGMLCSYGLKLSTPHSLTNLVRQTPHLHHLPVVVAEMEAGQNETNDPTSIVYQDRFHW